MSMCHARLATLWISTAHAQKNFIADNFTMFQMYERWIGWFMRLALLGSLKCTNFSVLMQECAESYATPRHNLDQTKDNDMHKKTSVMVCKGARGGGWKF